ncbi:triphosphoribosyl-dephospho-CoA synthase [Natrialba magadii ATCC 43099]|uniref:Triphosphoribosyl-dephospho-CoA protein n=1 Tax=Natrialba magadii (strain ATCC 43099 / DSM 3394 / CCM 3739 / CIP 104546 / IAM 13178 / JCM 8861 / NBRC 102185 / NCIMB 2190 / MS3) TaxID=547559 RepID=D3SVR6_NATMM|nr:triphosphoribosyl-dephospho-CoA synthase [Natrialba magadii]ADD03635.1 triphosphoribosyl-dephospho-CoA synthase [Natrialba magadii ATCC 43099]ELY34402.1 triphosphoribosyl-dephospho-CoA protein [Natrialba magadii ATCC 43099]
MRTPAQNAHLALLLEVASTPKPGNVDRHRDLEDLRFEHFLAGAVGSQHGLELAADGAAIGPAFERAVAGMAKQEGDNTQFGALLLLTPLVRAAVTDLSQPADLSQSTDPSQSAVESVVDETTVADAAAFYRAFEHVDVHVADPPADMAPLDVRRGSDAIPALEKRGLTLVDVMEQSVPGDDVAREWVTGFERSFTAAERLASADGPLPDRAAAVFLSLLAERPDTLVATKHGEGVAREVTDRASELAAQDALSTDRDAVEVFADDLVNRGINPGTTADITAAALFIALESELVSV